MVVRVRLSLMLLGMRATGTAGLRTRAKRLVHNLLDGTGTTAALSAATKTAVDLPGGTRQILDHGSTHVVIGEDVTGTNDHGLIGKPVRTLTNRYFTGAWDAKAKQPVLSYSKLGERTLCLLESV